MGNLEDNQPQQDRAIESNSNRSLPGTMQATVRLRSKLLTLLLCPLQKRTALAVSRSEPTDSLAPNDTGTSSPGAVSRETISDT